MIHLPEIASIILFSTLIFPGMILVLIPGMPAIPYMFLVALIFGFVDKFQNISPRNLIVLGVIVLLSIAVDYAAGILGAKYGGASKKSIIFGFLGSLLGTLLLPPFGGIVGIFAGVLIAEFMQFYDHKKAVKAASYTLAGSIAGLLVNFLLAIIFFTLFLVFVT